MVKWRIIRNLKDVNQFRKMGMLKNGIDLTAYYSKGSDMIQVVDQKNVNTGSFINKGIEVSAHSHPLKNL